MPLGGGDPGWTPIVRKCFRGNESGRRAAGAQHVRRRPNPDAAGCHLVLTSRRGHWRRLSPAHAALGLLGARRPVNGGHALDSEVGCWQGSRAGSACATQSDRICSPEPHVVPGFPWLRTSPLAGRPRSPPPSASAPHPSFLPKPLPHCSALAKAAVARSPHFSEKVSHLERKSWSRPWPWTLVSLLGSRGLVASGRPSCGLSLFQDSSERGGPSVSLPPPRFPPLPSLRRRAVSQSDTTPLCPHSARGWGHPVSAQPTAKRTPDIADTSKQAQRGFRHLSRPWKPASV